MQWEESWHLPLGETKHDAMLIKQRLSGQARIIHKSTTPFKVWDAHAFTLEYNWSEDKAVISENGNARTLRLASVFEASTVKVISPAKALPAPPRVAALEDAKRESDKDAKLESDKDATLEGDKDGELESDKDAKLEGDKDATLEGDKDANLEGDKDKDARLEGDRMRTWRVTRMAGSSRVTRMRRWRLTRLASSSRVTRMRTWRVTRMRTWRVTRMRTWRVTRLASSSRRTSAIE